MCTILRANLKLDCIPFRYSPYSYNIWDIFCTSANRAIDFFHFAICWRFQASFYCYQFSPPLYLMLRCLFFPSAVNTQTFLTLFNVSWDRVKSHLKQTSTEIHSYFITAATFFIHRFLSVIGLLSDHMEIFFVLYLSALSFFHNPSFLTASTQQKNREGNFFWRVNRARTIFLELEFSYFFGSSEELKRRILE